MVQLIENPSPPPSPNPPKVYPLVKPLVYTFAAFQYLNLFSSPTATPWKCVPVIPPVRVAESATI